MRSEQAKREDDAVTAVAIQARSAGATPRAAAALRVAVFALIPWCIVSDRPWRFAELPRELLFDVPGVLPPVLPGSVVLAGSAVLTVVCVLAATGRRWAMVAAVPLAWWILAVPQMYGKVNHYHHVWWLVVLFAAMPAVSALRWAWPTMGVVYLFPGLAKLAAFPVLVGDDGMLRIIEAQQWTRPWDSIVPVSPVLAQVAAVATIVFEVGFVFAAFTRHRRWAALVGLGFHMSTWAVMGIRFDVAALVLLVLIFDRSEPELDWQPVAVVILAGAMLAGIANSHGWPFAPYPPFDQAPTHRTVLEVRDADGDRVEWLEWMPGSRRHGLGLSILREPHRIPERCAVIAPAGGSCWAVTGEITSDGVRVVDEKRVG